MQGKNHIAIGLVAATIISKNTNIELNQQLLLYPSIVVASVLPDIDHDKSVLGRMIPIIPKIIKHRTITHSLIAVTVLYLLLMITNASQILITGFLVGYSLHLIADIPTGEGVPLLYPFVKKRLSVPVIPYRFLEEILFAILCGGLLFMCFTK